MLCILLLFWRTSDLVGWVLDTVSTDLRARACHVLLLYAVGKRWSLLTLLLSLGQDASRLSCLDHPLGERRRRRMPPVQSDGPEQGRKGRTYFSGETEITVFDEAGC